MIHVCVDPTFFFLFFYRLRIIVTSFKKEERYPHFGLLIMSLLIIFYNDAINENQFINSNGPEAHIPNLGIFIL